MRNQITKSQLQSLPTLAAAAAAETNFPFWLGIENTPVSLCETEKRKKYQSQQRIDGTGAIATVAAAAAAYQTKTAKSQRAKLPNARR